MIGLRIPGLVFLSLAFALSFLASVSLPYLTALDITRTHYNTVVKVEEESLSQIRVSTRLLFCPSQTNFLSFSSVFGLYRISQSYLRRIFTSDLLIGRFVGMTRMTTGPVHRKDTVTKSRYGALSTQNLSPSVHPGHADLQSTPLVRPLHSSLLSLPNHSSSILSYRNHFHRYTTRFLYTRLSDPRRFHRGVLCRLYDTYRFCY